jgi:hypothetical protein
MDPVTVALAAALFSGGWLVGRHARLKAKPPLPYCLCKHHYGDHDPDNGICQAAWQEKQRSWDKATRWVERGCNCVRYTGPQPVEQFWVPPAAEMTIITAPRPVRDADA